MEHGARFLSSLRTAEPEDEETSSSLGEPIAAD